MKQLPAVIKWSGSKRSVALAIAQLLPKTGRYYEPFLGGGIGAGELRPTDVRSPATLFPS